MKKRIFRISLSLTLIVLLSGLLANCTSASPNAGRTITIAVVEDNPLNADGTVNSQSIYAGVSLAADQMRSAGGIDLQVEVYDDDNDPEKAKEIAEQISVSEAVAVVGHSSFETLEASADVYENAGLTAINVTPISEHFNQSYYYHFNLAYTVETEAAYVANYLRKVTGTETAGIFYTRDSYGIEASHQFKNTFQGLGGKVTLEKEIRGSSSLDEVISAIFSANENPGVLFIAADDATSAELVILLRQKGIGNPIAGVSNLSSPVFITAIEAQQEERAFPGYYTDGILTTRSLFFDSADRYGLQFLEAYQLTYPNTSKSELVYPSNQVVNGYDAAITIFNAIQTMNISGSNAQVEADREKIYTALTRLDGEEQTVLGVADIVVFEPSQNSTRAPSFGVYQNGGIASANIQFKPITAPNTLQDLNEQIVKGRIITINGNYAYKTNVVYAGIDLLGIDDIDIKTSTYEMDFYLWFRYRPNELDADFKPEDFVFTNAEGELAEPTLIRDEENEDGTRLLTYRVIGVFKNQFHFYSYPFDRQALTVEFRNQNADTTYIQYVVDRVGMRYTTDDALLTNFKANGAFDSIFGWRENTVRVTQDILPNSSTLGNPANFDQNVSTDFSLVTLDVELDRDSLPYIVKSLLPLLLTLILAYITFFLPLGHEERLTVGSTALLTTAFFHLTLADSLPEIGHTVAMEYLFYASYIMSALIVLLETLSSRYEKRIEDARKKVERQQYQQFRHKLDMFGRIVYPSIMLVALGVEFLVYNGSLQLGPEREAQVETLAGLALKAEALEPSEMVDDATSVPASGDVTLSLGNWRPEDVDEMQILLDAFEAYALKTTGRNITVEYRPVTSVNYDSILDLQFHEGNAPDLFYVRPYSVDGHVIKHLAPLNYDLPLENKYAPTRLDPWTNSESGLYYAVPFVGVTQGVYYNKDIFAQYGLETPETWEAFMSAVRILKSADEDLIPVANSLNPSEDSEMFMSLAANFLGGPIGRDRFMRTDGTGMCYDSAPVIKTFQAIEDLKPYLPENADVISSQVSKELFLGQKAVMLFGGSWDAQKIASEARFEWGVFAVPAPFLSETYVIFQPDIGIGMSNETEHSEEAKLFLDWLGTQEAIDIVSANIPGFYPLSALQTKKSAGPEDALFLQLANDYPTDLRWMYTEISRKSPSALDIIRRDLNAMLTNDLSPRQAAQNLQAGLSEWYEPAQTCRR